MLVRKIRQLNRQLGIPAALHDVGVTEEYFDVMADDAMKSGNIAVNPRDTKKQDILELYRLAL
jgi:alcohol dehydrogenase